MYTSLLHTALEAINNPTNVEHGIDSLAGKDAEGYADLSSWSRYTAIFSEVSINISFNLLLKCGDAYLCKLCLNLITQKSIWAALFMLLAVSFLATAILAGYPALYRLFVEIFSVGDETSLEIEFLFLAMIRFIPLIGVLGLTVLAAFLPAFWEKLRSLLLYRISLVVSSCALTVLILCFLFCRHCVDVIVFLIELVTFWALEGIFMPIAWMSCFILLKNTVFRSETGLALAIGFYCKFETCFPSHFF